ncbi:MAG: JAB domain-containing protein [Nitrospirota bacterium]
MRVKLTREQRIQVLNSQDIYKIMQQILLRENKIGRSKEHFWVVCLSNSNRILLIEMATLGTMKKSVIDPTEVFSFALQKRASKVIMVHNHPGGKMEPSLEDKDITDRMYQAGLFLELPVIDHLIIDEEGYYSFTDSGLLKKISLSQKYVLPYKQEEERIQKRGEKKKTVEMARAMKKKGMDLALIAEVSGLSIKEIEKL